MCRKNIVKMSKISFLLTHKLSSFINDQYDIKFVFVIVIFKIINNYYIFCTDTTHVAS